MRRTMQRSLGVRNYDMGALEAGEWYRVEHLESIAWGFHTVWATKAVSPFMWTFTVHFTGSSSTAFSRILLIIIIVMRRWRQPGALNRKRSTDNNGIESSFKSRVSRMTLKEVWAQQYFSNKYLCQRKTYGSYVIAEYLLQYLRWDWCRGLLFFKHLPANIDFRQASCWKRWAKQRDICEVRINFSCENAFTQPSLGLTLCINHSPFTAIKVLFDDV